MQIFRRITVRMCSAAMLLWAVSCSESEPAAEMPGAMPDTVIIGCAGVGAEIESRTELGADGLSVQWVSGDEIRLWARPAEGDGAFTVANVPFRFDYFSPSRSRAGFTGTIPDVENLFTANSYDYCAITPVPADENLDGTLATYTIPAVQTGRFDPAIDIMTARQKDAAPLKEGDNNPYIRLEFEHHIHVLKFTIPSCKLTEDIVALELTFPHPVAGTFKVDAAGEQNDDMSALDQSMLRIEFPKGEERHEGDTFYVTIAPVEFASGETIGMRVMATTIEASVDYTFDKARTFAAGHQTPIALNVPEADTYFTVLQFSVAEGVIAGRPNEPGCYGENTLGERMQEARLVGEAGAFSNAVSMMPTGYCEIQDTAENSIVLCKIPTKEEADAIGFDGTYTLTYVSRKDPSSKCPYDVWQKEKVSGRTIPYEFESPQTLVQTTNFHDGTEIRFDAVVPTIEDGKTNLIAAPLSIPYLLYEEFQNVATVHNLDDESLSAGPSYKFNNAASNLADTGIPYGTAWSGVQYGTEQDAIRVCNRSQRAVGVAGNYRGRLDTPNLCFVKGTARVTISFDYSMNRATNNSTYNQHYFSFGTHTRTGTRNSDNGTGNGLDNSITWVDANVADSNMIGSYTNINTPLSYTLDCTRDTRFVWGVYLQENLSILSTSYHNYWLYLDNIRAFVVPQE